MHLVAPGRKSEPRLLPGHMITYTAAHARTKSTSHIQSVSSQYVATQGAKLEASFACADEVSELKTKLTGDATHMATFSRSIDDSP